MSTRKPKFKPRTIFLLSALLMFLCGIFSESESAMDIHFHDTYVVIAYAHLIFFAGFLLLNFWFIYWLLARVLYSKVLSWLHIVPTALLLCLVAVISAVEAFSGMPRRYFDYSAIKTFSFFSNVNLCIVVLIGVGLIAQFFFVMNIVLGAISRIRRIKN